MINDNASQIVTMRSDGEDAEIRILSEGRPEENALQDVIQRDRIYIP